MIKSPTRHGFSLVELSIVLVILGLLTGGILAGQSLIRASELRAASTEYQRYAAAVNTFRDKYFAIPGDFSSATRFWGRLNANADCVTNSSAAVAAPGACDGNGGGTLNDAGTASQSGELMQIWRHLALAGLIEGNYSGLSGATNGTDFVIGTNSPKSKLGNAGWGTRGLGVYAGDAQAYAMDYGNLFVLGGQLAGLPPHTAVLKPEEAWNIDTKMDDGKPAQGKVIARYWNNACAAADDGTHANNDLAASYKLSDSTNQCSLYFRQQF
ncbi:MAG: prepilin-type N-terminal cleavage/methylation domain-containing protein [Alphaproteobacteria bacterium]|nr:prepilin-type N-terminal cleavage/methylation domain-containing protein [Alphaproteobacteria bacterium]